MQKNLFIWVSFLAMVSANALANTLPINGMNTGEISGFYPNYFVPAGYTFSIWGIIYLLLGTYAVAFVNHTQKATSDSVIKKLFLSNFTGFVASCWLNAAWIVCWHYLNMEGSLLVMFSLFLILATMFTRGIKVAAHLSTKEQLLVLTPISVYFGWISVATIANITAALVKYNFNPTQNIAVMLSTILIVVAGLLGGFLSYKYKSYGYASAIVWAVVGVWVAQHDVDRMMYVSPIISLGILYTGVIIGAFRKNRA